MGETGPVSAKVKIGGVLILLVGVVAAYLVLNKERDRERQLNEYLRARSTVPSPTALARPSATPTPTPPVNVRFENEPMVPAAIRSQLLERVVSPLVDYYAEVDAQNKVKDFKISVNSSPTAKTFPYVASVEFEKGASLSFVIEKWGNSFAWWKPECPKGCKFSDEYRRKYPEVVKK